MASKGWTTGKYTEDTNFQQKIYTQLQNGDIKIGLGGKRTTEMLPNKMYLETFGEGLSRTNNVYSVSEF